MAKSHGSRLDGGICTSPSHRTIRRTPNCFRAIGSMVHPRATKSRRARIRSNCCSGGRQSSLRAALQPYFYCVCRGKACSHHPGYSAAEDAERRTVRDAGISRPTATDHQPALEDMDLRMSRVSTHVLDVSLGKPAKDVSVRL